MNVASFAKSYRVVEGIKTFSDFTTKFPEWRIIERPKNKVYKEKGTDTAGYGDTTVLVLSNRKM